MTEGQRMPHYLLIYTSPDSGELRFELESGRSYRMGSKEDNDIVLAQRDVSRHHAILRVVEGSFHLTDLSSKNGTFVNGQQITDASLRCGDLIGLSSARLVVVETTTDGLRPATDPGSSDDDSPGLAREDTQQFRSETSVEDLVELLEVTAGAVGASAVAAPLTWAVRHFRLDAAVVLFRGPDDRVGMITSAGDLGPLVSNSDVLARLVLEQRVGASEGARIQQVNELGERLIVARVGDRGHVLVARAPHTSPEVTEVRALVAAVEAVLVAGEGALGAPVTSIASRAGEVGSDSPLERLWGGSRAMVDVRARLAELAAARVRHVLLRGESGTGKALAAAILHELSERATGPCFEVRCGRGDGSAELMARLVGATPAKRGAVGLAQGGTLVVRNAGVLSPPEIDRVQRLASAGPDDRNPTVVWCLRRSGSDRPTDSSKHLEQTMAGAVIDVAPLRERSGDVPILVSRLIHREAERPDETAFTADAYDLMNAYSWPGNVRELESEILRLLALHPEGGLIGRELLALRDHPELGGWNEPWADPSWLSTLDLAEARDRFERWVILRALDECDGNQSRAAERLGLSRAGLFKKMRRLELT